MCNCMQCVNCWFDESVGDRECMVAENLTDDELVEHFEDLKEGCPCFKQIEEQDYEYLVALSEVLERNGILPPFTV